MSDPSAETSDLASPLPTLQTAHLANISAAMFDVQHPVSIGPYHIRSVIGRGGMGIVYLAEQLEPIRRTVAIKVIKVGMDTEQVIARFASERQAVALMNHPNVARVLDAGATETGRPYFVMEHVAGEPITEFADGHRLTLRQRLDLFIQACQAVEHAHQKAIIHRDLKPSNILVAAQGSDSPGVVKVIDFGLAKAIGSSLGQQNVTEVGQLLGTPEYMSPEQADLNAVDIDTRTDVYSLGVVLYELLAGVLPFDATALRSGGLSQVQRIIREVDPPSPAIGLSNLGEKAEEVAGRRRLSLPGLAGQLRGELEWIVLKALRKERSERYATATELADDVRRYLDNLPLRAGPTTIVYRARKFFRRNRGKVAAAAMVVLALVAGIAGTTWQAVRATRAQTDLEKALQDVSQQKRQVEQSNDALKIAQKDLTSALTEVRRQKGEADTANASLTAVNRFLIDDLLKSADPSIARGQELTVRESLDAAARNVDRRFKDQPMVEASIRHALATTYDALGLPEQALPHARRALELRSKHLGDAAPETVEALNGLVVVLQTLARTDEAEPLCREAIERARPYAEKHPQLLVSALSQMALTHRSRGRWSDAEDFLRQSHAAARKAYGDQHESTIIAISNIATMLVDRGRPAEAEPLLREVIAAQQKALGDDHPDTLLAQTNLARALADMKKVDEAEKLHRAALSAMTRVLGPDHPTTLVQVRNLGGLLEDQKRYKEAAALYRPTLATMRKTLGDDHPETIGTANHLASLLLDTGEVAEAAALNTQVLASCRKQLGDDHPFTIMSMNNLGMAHAKLQQFDKAEPLFAEAYRRAPRSELDAVKQAYCMSRWGPCLVEMGRYTEAEAPLREAYQRLKAQDLVKTEPMYNVLVGLIRVSERANRAEETMRWRNELRAIVPATSPAP